MGKPTKKWILLLIILNVTIIFTNYSNVSTKASPIVDEAEIDALFNKSIDKDLMVGINLAIFGHLEPPIEDICVNQ